MAEFAHPDVIIGLTILAYRYEGLREQDLKNVILELQERMSEQYGPFHDRTACVQYEKWISTAGRRVRGWRKTEVRRVCMNGWYINILVNSASPSCFGTLL
jgi:hypothetical protein